MAFKHEKKFKGGNKSDVYVCTHMCISSRETEGWMGNSRLRSGVPWKTLDLMWMVAGSHCMFFIRVG